MKKTLPLLLLTSVVFLANCAKNAEVTFHKLCDDATNKASIERLVPLYSEPSTTSSVVEMVPAGTVVKVIDHRNHNVWNPKYFVKVQTANKEGYMSPKCFVANQDPSESVYRYAVGKVTDYKYFYDPSDKAHYEKGYEYKSLASLPKEKVSLKELLGK